MNGKSLEYNNVQVQVNVLIVIMYKILFRTVFLVLDNLSGFQKVKSPKQVTTVEWFRDQRDSRKSLGLDNF